MKYFEPLKAAFENAADPVYAAGMKSYMRGKFDYYGIRAPLRDSIIAAFVKDNPVKKIENHAQAVCYCWEQPQREWQYTGMLILSKFATKADEKYLEYAEFMVVYKSWWDTVDFIAANIVGAYLKKNPGQIDTWIDRWMESENMWLQRVCLLFQLKYGGNTDNELLFSLCKQLSGHQDFFIRKAIGWALRQYSKTNPAEVIVFVNTHRLSPLSAKEAMKVIERKKG